MIHFLLAIIYLSFISLGLPDALLGAAWPNMYVDLQTSFSYAGIIFMLISAGTVVSSLMSDRMTYILGTGKVTAICVGLSATCDTVLTINPLSRLPSFDVTTYKP